MDILMEYRRTARKDCVFPGSWAPDIGMCAIGILARVYAASHVDNVAGTGMPIITVIPSLSLACCRKLYYVVFYK